MRYSMGIDSQGTTLMIVERRCLPIAAWPEQDRLAWEAGSQAADLFEPKGAGANWSPRSRVDRPRLRSLVALVGAEESPQPNTNARRPGDQMVIADYVAMLSATCAPYTVVCRCRNSMTHYAYWHRTWIGAGSLSFTGGFVDWRSPPGISRLACDPHAIWSILVVE